METKNKYANMAKLAISMASDKSIIREGFAYPKGMTDRMHPKIEDAIRNRKTSIGDHPALPIGGHRSFDQKILIDRFCDVVNTYKSAFDIENTSDVSEDEIVSSGTLLLNDCVKIESSNRNVLEDLAISLVMNEFGIDADTITINAKLVDKVSMASKIERDFSDDDIVMEFNKHSEIEQAESEIMKRRFINAMVHGSANKSNHMYHMMAKDLNAINPTLVNKYKKIIALTDYLYFKMHNTKSVSTAGLVNVDYDDSGKIVINAEAVIFPVLIHEIVKGLMEAISLHGFTEDEKLNEYVVSQADFLGAEAWDLRIGPALWERFMNCIPVKDNDIKHHVFHSLVKLPVNKFNETMREILAGTNEGKSTVLNIIRSIKGSMNRERIELDRNNRDQIAKSRSISDVDRLLNNDIDDLFR